MGEGVVAIAGLVVGLGIAVEPGGDRVAVPERGEFEQWQVVTPPVEADEGGALVVLPPLPEVAGDDLGAIAGGVECHQVEQPAMAIDLGDRDRDGEHVGDGEDVFAVGSFGGGLFAEPGDRLGGRELVVGIPDAADEVAVGNRFAVEDEVADRVAVVFHVGNFLRCQREAPGC